LALPYHCERKNRHHPAAATVWPDCIGRIEQAARTDQLKAATGIQRKGSHVDLCITRGIDQLLLQLNTATLPLGWSARVPGIPLQHW
jgi:hypothetical protein